MYRALSSQSVFWCCSLQAAAPHLPPTSAKSEYWMRLVAYCLLTHIAVLYSRGCMRTLVGTIFLFTKTNPPNAKEEVNRLIVFIIISVVKTCLIFLRPDSEKSSVLFSVRRAGAGLGPDPGWRQAKDHAPAKCRTPTRPHTQRTAASTPLQTPQEALPVLFFKLPVWNAAETGKMCSTDSARSF